MITSWVESPYPAWAGLEDKMSDDNGWHLPEGPFIGVFDDKVMAGAFYAKQMSTFCWEIHGGVSKSYWGNGEAVCYDAGVFLFNSTPCLKIVAMIPDFNKLMIKCVKGAGMKLEGTLTKSFLKNLRLHDQLIFGAQKSEVMECQQPLR